MRALIINAIGFQCTWLALVLGGDLFFLMALAWWGVHVIWFAQPGETSRILILGAIGFVMDSLLTLSGVFRFPESPWALMPLWFCGLWVAFPTVLNASLRWVWSRHWLFIPLSGFGASTTYVGGSRLGPLELPLGDWPSIALLTAVWAVYFTVCRCVFLGRFGTTHAVVSDQSQDPSSSG